MSRATIFSVLKWLLVLAALAFAVWLGRAVFDVSIDDLRIWIESYGIWAPVIYIIFYTVRPLIFFPASLLSLAGGLVFGVWLGTFYTIIGAVSGAMLSYAVARGLGKKIFKKDWDGNAAKIQQQMEQNGFLYILIFRLIPVINFDLISYLAAFAKVRFGSFTSATLIGIIPGTFAYNFLGSSAASGNPKMILLASSVFILLTILPVYFRKRWINKQKKDLE
ncbi:TVP38/TMEM64 family protein [Planomicrobium sp. Y74]|uniref:TVP38/TMEM64 family protein n=1 Tax=Planomicrobium sp. Y74 TaxID=2478977 RepID=UPI000EF4587D|nr:TVP38/TMEM64 family protein [Planomicrobium sp. Y74]RLQ92202.1 TVP38/TMEM64 family protein [Planomicrobium sp. Y74]